MRISRDKNTLRWQCIKLDTTRPRILREYRKFGTRASLRTMRTNDNDHIRTRRVYINRAVPREIASNIIKIFVRASSVTAESFTEIQQIIIIFRSIRLLYL